MGIPGSANLLLAAGEAQAYQLKQSLRFNDNDSAYLQLNGGTSPTNGKIATHSVWVKRSLVESSDPTVFGSSPAGTLWNDIKFDGNDRLIYRQYHSSGGASLWALTTAARYRDPSAWLHIVVAIDTTQATAANRVKMYVNGAQITAWDQETYPGQNQEPLGQQGSYAVGIGRLTTTFSNYFDGYIAEYHHVDGTAHVPTDFGEYDDNGVWRPIEVTGITYGNRGWYLTFDPTATNGIGHDHSGSGNHFTANNFATSGTGTDVMSDTPTTNWATLNAVDPTADTLSNGNLVSTGTSNWESRRATFAMTSGKWYWEVTPTTSAYVFDGVVNNNANLSQYVGQNANGWAFDTSTGNIVNNASSTAYGSATASGVVLGFAFDADTGKMWVRNASGFFNSGDPAAGTNPAMTAGAGEYYPAVSNYESSTSNTCNFGQRAFAYTPPTGFKALNTSNLPAPDIADGSENFNTVLWTGNGGTQAVTGVGFQPDMTWVKSRSISAEHWINDAVRGAGYSLPPSNTLSEQDYRTLFTSFDSDGFSLASGTSSFNQTSATYVGWNWKANGAGSSNTAGSITSTVSANPTAGFSVITWNTSSSSAYTVGHGLGVAPKVLIVKKRDGATNWFVRHGAVHTGNGALFLNSTGTGDSGSTVFNGTNPSSTVITLNGASTDLRGSQVCYAFAEVENYSKFGSYIGNGSNNGPFVYCGFKPAFLLGKASSTTSQWFIWDAERNTYNPLGDILYPNLSSPEGASALDVDFTSNGFKFREGGGAGNDSNVTYIFMAFAENPFGGDGVSPATAR